MQIKGINDLQHDELHPMKVVWDRVSTTVTYYGFTEAGKGTATSDPLWRIYKVDKSAAGYEVYAEDNPDFIFIWDNRLSYTYL